MSLGRTCFFLVAFTSCGLERRMTFDLKMEAPFCAGLGVTHDSVSMSCEPYGTVPSEPLWAIWLTRGNAMRGTAIVFHGMSEGAANTQNLAFGLDLARLSYNVLLVEYTGYRGERRRGRYPLRAQPSARQTIADAESAFDLVVQRLGVPERDVTLIGYSLGSGVAAQLAVRHQAVRALILIAPYTTYREAAPIACRAFLWQHPSLARPICAPLAVLVADDFNTRSVIGHIQPPVCLIYGGGPGCEDGDGLIPASMPEKLAAIAHDSVRIQRCQDTPTTKFNHQTMRKGAAQLIVDRCRP
jgi:dienelactone hydrolase